MAHMKNSLTNQARRGKALVSLMRQVARDSNAPSLVQVVGPMERHPEEAAPTGPEVRFSGHPAAAPLSDYLTQPAVTAKLQQELDRLDAAAFAHWDVVRDTAARTDVRGIRPLLETFVPVDHEDENRFTGRVQIRTVQTFDDTSTTWLKSSGRAIPGCVHGHIDADGNPVIDSAEIVFAQPA